jgi:hypothetical protein
MDRNETEKLKARIALYGRLAKKEPLQDCAGPIIGHYVFGTPASEAMATCPNFVKFCSTLKTALSVKDEPRDKQLKRQP